MTCAKNEPPYCTMYIYNLYIVKCTCVHCPFLLPYLIPLPLPPAPLVRGLLPTPNELEHVRADPSQVRGSPLIC